MDLQKVNQIFFDQNPLAEPFEVTTPDGSVVSLKLIFDNADMPSVFNGLTVVNDDPTIDIQTLDVVKYKIVKGTVVKRNKTGETFKIYDQTPDLDGSIICKLKR